ncbi:MAG: hypothetical protein A2Z34_02425 [Planctomycetes bacterium RBG_16_59_8]|nr:MAG: hypothetical protein A2Z34_02425 [Planctomycetes bacterium RBG_16_59_8]
MPPLYANTKTYATIMCVGEKEQAEIDKDKEHWIKRRYSINELLQFLKEGTDIQREIAASDLRLIRSPEIMQALFDAEVREKNKHVLWHLRLTINAHLRLFGDGGEDIERAKKWWKSGRKQLADFFDNKKLPCDNIRDFNQTNSYNLCYGFAYPYCEGKEYPKENFTHPFPTGDQ